MRCTNVKIVLIIENITGVPHLTKKTKEYFMGAKSEMKLRKLLFLESKIYTRLQKKQLLYNWWITRQLFTKLGWKT